MHSEKEKEEVRCKISAINFRNYVQNLLMTGFFIICFDEFEFAWCQPTIRENQVYIAENLYSLDTYLLQKDPKY